MKKNITPFKHKITKKVRQIANGNKSQVLWFTGLSGSGKSTLACAVEEALFKRGIKTYILDGDNIRTGLNTNLGFSPEDREENIRRIGEVAKLFVDAGVVVLTAFISPYLKDRQQVRKIVGNNEFIEIYVKCPLEVCEKRDTKGLYKKAREGKIQDFTGINAPYEEPDAPEIVIETDKESVENATKLIFEFVYQRITNQDESTNERIANYQQITNQGELTNERIANPNKSADDSVTNSQTFTDEKKKRQLKRDDLLYPELSYKIIGCAYEVFNEVGGGHPEAVYQNGMAQEFAEKKIPVKEQVYYPVKFKFRTIGKNYIDFIVEEKVVTELKKGTHFSKAHIDQVLKYLKVTGLKLALLINFGSNQVSFKRIINFN